VVGGHADTLREVEKRTALLEKVLRPLLMRFGDHPAVLAWEVMHAPDRRTLQLPASSEPQPPSTATRMREAVRRGWRSLGRALGLSTKHPETPAWVGWEQMREFLSDAVTLVHRHTQALATVGVSTAAELELVRGLGLDFYAVDWDAEASEETLRRAVSDLRLDRPLLLGAFPGRHPGGASSRCSTPPGAPGTAGTFVWSVLQPTTPAGYDGRKLSRGRGTTPTTSSTREAPPLVQTIGTRPRRGRNLRSPSSA
jgi:hypothetical protein